MRSKTCCAVHARKKGQSARADARFLRFATSVPLTPRNSAISEFWCGRGDSDVDESEIAENIGKYGATDPVVRQNSVGASRRGTLARAAVRRLRTVRSDRGQWTASPEPYRLTKRAACKSGVTVPLPCARGRSCGYAACRSYR